ncbi:hypothetical protein BH09MYX1_BH09MYX1_49560 [soil metagenome]
MTARVAALFVLLAFFGLSACQGETMPDVYGLRLGMTASDVRDRFWGTGGSFKADVAADDYAIHWTPGASTEAKDPSGKSTAFEPNPTAMTFEFHMGTLVAVRGQVPAGASIAHGAEYVTTKSAVLHRAAVPGGGNVSIDLLARDCPTHKAEADRFVSAAKAR